LGSGGSALRLGRKGDPAIKLAKAVFFNAVVSIKIQEVGNEE